MACQDPEGPDLLFAFLSQSTLTSKAMAGPAVPISFSTIDLDKQMEMDSCPDSFRPFHSPDGSLQIYSSDPPVYPCNPPKKLGRTTHSSNDVGP